MADVSQLEVNGTTYNICDATARDSLSHVLESVYPVGATYISIDATNPATLFGFGTWTRIEGKFLLGATREGTGSGASQIAGATGGAATVTLTAAQSGLPAHNHGTTITQPAFNTPSLSHSSITQPAFNTPELTHSVTQPTVKYTAPASHTHNLNENNAYAYLSISSAIRYRYASLSSNWTAEYGTTASLSAGNYSSAHADVVSLGGKTESATGAGTSNGTSASVSGCAVAKHSAAACTRSTNVAVGAHAAAACTRATDVGVTVSNNTAADATAAHNNMPPFLAVYIWYRSA